MIKSSTYYYLAFSFVLHHRHPWGGGRVDTRSLSPVISVTRYATGVYFIPMLVSALIYVTLLFCYFILFLSLTNYVAFTVEIIVNASAMLSMTTDNCTSR